MKRYTIASIEAVRHPVLRIIFEDGVVGEIDLSEEIAKGRMLKPLGDPEYFKTVALHNDGRAYGWNLDEVGHEIDFCADSARAEIETRIVSELAEEWRTQHGRALESGRGATRRNVGKVVATPKYEIFRDSLGAWRWHFVAGDGKVVAQSAEGYASKEDCFRSIHLVTSSDAAVVTESDTA